ncbi:YceI family protein [Roseovarius ramblicola]|uniref:YceI family protein n=1 Tax=Roseovarius ramblicola TaxID=2022336 RepID=A0ABV5I4N9_9RHOB
MIRLALAALLIAAQALAAPAPYRLDTDRSVVGFTYSLAGNAGRGTMPVASADMVLDLANPGQSRVTVTLDASGARAGFFLATQAMKGPQGLDTARHPSITFRSTAITGTLGKARVEGLLTVRGTTRKVTLDAGLYRQRGTDAADLTRLTVLLTGQVDRHDFGVTGFPGLVGPMIGLRIVARIARYGE